MRWISLLTLLFASMPLNGCSGDTCGVEGSTQECVCTDGSTGSQSCRDDGAWSECVCDEHGASADAGEDRADTVTTDVEEEETTDGGDFVDASPIDAAAADVLEGGETDAGGDAADEDTPTDIVIDGVDTDSPSQERILYGSYRVENSLDAEFLFEFTEITGDLIVVAPGLVELRVPKLRTVGGLLDLLNNTLTAVEFPALRSVGSKLRVAMNANLTSIEFPALRSVGDDFNVAGNTALAQCLVDTLVAQVEAAEGIEGVVLTSHNREDCTCSEVEGEVTAACPD